jgi:hypothetical protein
VVFVAGALPPHTHKELSFLELVHFERCAFKKAKVFGVPSFQKGDKMSLITQDTKDPTLLSNKRAVRYTMTITVYNLTDDTNRRRTLWGILA